MTDIEGSTRLLQALPEGYPGLLEDHHELLRGAFGAVGGIEASVEGDALFFAFADAPSAVHAALEGQRRLARHVWPAGATVRVRMGLHTGEGRLLGGEYVGLDVHRTARIVTAGHGGQVVVSDAARALAEARLPPGASFRDLGEHRLKDIDRSEHLFQLAADGLATEFPPLRSLTGRPNNLPAQMTSFVGRDLEKQQLLEHLAASRLVTLTGPGGTGKTRLSLEAARALLDRFADGVYFVPLATISDPELLVITLAATLGVREGPARPIREGLIEYLRDRTILLVLDNFEQLLSAAPTVGELLAAAPRLRVL
ncbi:MAG: adenylate/guanylate cyclase domain-containing protein, partial [Chloroflexi bacterium]|nr:adenylate/guanylate cyclase domain-containing protein [Chloroflexota bacterium]